MSGWPLGAPFLRLFLFPILIQNTPFVGGTIQWNDNALWHCNFETLFWIGVTGGTVLIYQANLGLV